MSKKEEVLKYVLQHPNCSEEEIAKALKIDLISVMDTLVKLEKEGKVKAVA